MTLSVIDSRATGSGVLGELFNPSISHPYPTSLAKVEFRDKRGRRIKARRQNISFGGTERLERELSKYVEKRMELGLSDVEATCPVRTGFLRSSLRLGPDRVQLYPEAFYGKYVEVNRPFMKPVFDKLDYLLSRDKITARISIFIRIPYDNQTLRWKLRPKLTFAGS